MKLMAYGLINVTEPHNKKIRKVIIGAKAAEGIMNELEHGTLIITPSDRIDIIESVLNSKMIKNCQALF